MLRQSRTIRQSFPAAPSPCGGCAGGASFPTRGWAASVGLMLGSAFGIVLMVAALFIVRGQNRKAANRAR